MIVTLFLKMIQKHQFPNRPATGVKQSFPSDGAAWRARPALGQRPESKSSQQTEALCVKLGSLGAELCVRLCRTCPQKAAPSVQLEFKLGLRVELMNPLPRTCHRPWEAESDRVSHIPGGEFFPQHGAEA